MLNVQVKNDWVAALKSGKYPQTNGCLSCIETEDPNDTPVGYCCLGVLCEINNLVSTVTSRIHKRIGHDGDYSVSVKNFRDIVNTDTGKGDTDYMGLPPNNFCDKIGLGAKEIKELYTMNDHGISFDSIANYIEKNL